MTTTTAPFPATTTDPTNAMPTFAAPGPGVWELESTHFSRPFPRFGLDGVRRASVRALKESTARYGLLLSHFDFELVNGFMYLRAVPFGAPAGAKGPPPRVLIWLLTRLHPGMRARIREGERAMAEKRWRRDLAEWDGVDKPEALRKHAALLAIDPTALDDVALAAHLHACDRHIEEMIYLHHKYTMTCSLPVGDLLAHATRWTGRDAGELLRLLRGASRISLGFSAQELGRAATMIRNDPRATEVLLGGDGGAGTVDALIARGGMVGATTRQFVELVRHRALGYDVGERTCGEMPEMLVKALRATRNGEFRGAEHDGGALEASIREAVPAEHRAAFDELLAEARFITRLRDERGLYADCWAVGIARRGLLEAGRRLAARRLLASPYHAVDLDADEAEALLTGRNGPRAAAVQERCAWRLTKSAADAPAVIGGEPSAPPDPALLPAAARRSAAAVDIFVQNLFAEDPRASSNEVIRGLSVNPGCYVGTARRVNGVSDFHRIEQGDVLVTSSTAASFNVVLPMLGAIVTDRGGQLSHAAIVAREYGIPGIVGTRAGTRLIPDGAWVHVDGGSGEVTILAA